MGERFKGPRLAIGLDGSFANEGLTAAETLFTGGWAASTWPQAI